jgi:hypothetical protein
MVLRFVVDVHATCFGLHGHLQVCMIFHFLFLKESASLLLLPLLHVVILCIYVCTMYILCYTILCII